VTQDEHCPTMRDQLFHRTAVSEIRCGWAGWFPGIWESCHQNESSIGQPVKALVTVTVTAFDCNSQAIKRPDFNRPQFDIPSLENRSGFETKLHDNSGLLIPNRIVRRPHSAWPYHQILVATRGMLYPVPICGATFRSFQPETRHVLADGATCEQLLFPCFHLNCPHKVMGGQL
jgi:hypothetical protein